jgi:hypothetical protein
MYITLTLYVLNGYDTTPCQSFSVYNFVDHGIAVWTMLLQLENNFQSTRTMHVFKGELRRRHRRLRIAE